MPEPAEKMWCRVTKVCNCVFGYTASGDLAVMSRSYGNMHLAEVGDIVEFSPKIPHPQPGSGLRKPARWYGDKPHIIAWHGEEQPPDPPKHAGDEETWNSYLAGEGVSK
jgi:hypothetical protein